MGTRESADRDDAPRRPIVPRSPRSLRLTFAYDRDAENGGVRFVRAEHVRTVAPGIATDPPQPGQSGAWFEVRDVGGMLLYYQPLHDPMPTTTEVFSDESGRPALSRIPGAPQRGEFRVLMPDLPDAASFAFFASGIAPSVPPARPTRRRPAQQGSDVPPERRSAQELARVSFDELRRRAAIAE